MVENIKVDMIYYNCHADFEMEFYLGGCCQMRLLSDNAKEKKEFVNKLARAVSRSKVIICVGQIFGEDNIMDIVSTSVKIPLETIDNDAYGIKSSSEIEVISGALPLVTADGIFGGCIVESGPQSIIILSSSKSVRKNITESLIHPYIAQMGAMNLMQSAAEPATEVLKEEIPETADAAEEITEETVGEEETEEILEETEQTGEIAEEISEEEGEIKGGEEGEKITPAVPVIDDEFYIEPGKVKFSKKNYYDTDYDYGEGTELFYTETEPAERRPISFRVPVLVFTVLLLVAVLLMVYVLVFIPLSAGVDMGEYFKSIFTPTAEIMGRLR